MSVIVITNENFEKEVINSQKPVLLDFWSPTCGPCLRLAPLVDEIANEQDAVKICKVNVSEYPELAMQFDIMSIPLLVLVQDGKIVARHEGFWPNQKELMQKMLAPYMEKAQ